MACLDVDVGSVDLPVALTLRELFRRSDSLNFEQLLEKLFGIGILLYGLVFFFFIDIGVPLPLGSLGGNHLGIEFIGLGVDVIDLGVEVIPFRVGVILLALYLEIVLHGLVSSLFTPAARNRIKSVICLALYFIRSTFCLGSFFVLHFIRLACHEG